VEDSECGGKQAMEKAAGFEGSGEQALENGSKP
jgi:hypothetical protein